MRATCLPSAARKTEGEELGLRRKETQYRSRILHPPAAAWADQFEGEGGRGRHNLGSHLLQFEKFSANQGFGGEAGKWGDDDGRESGVEQRTPCCEPAIMTTGGVH